MVSTAVSTSIPPHDVSAFRDSADRAGSQSCRRARRDRISLDRILRRKLENYPVGVSTEYSGVPERPAVAAGTYVLDLVETNNGKGSISCNIFIIANARKILYIYIHTHIYIYIYI